MIIPNLLAFDSELRRLQEIPETFFKNLEAATSFDDSLFPDWLTDKDGNAVVFGNSTVLREKFKAIYEKYKAIQSAEERQKILDAFNSSTRILDLCNNVNGVSCIELTELQESIREEIDSAFLYLYNSGLKHHEFEVFVGASIKPTIKKFLDDNRIEVCPFCGLESILLLDGQERVPLDHWLNKDKFPFASVNFQNLIPIGNSCNGPGVKGRKNVLKDSTQLYRVKAYYPYSTYQGVEVKVSCKTLPNPDQEYGIWEANVTPRDNSEKDSFDSWSYIFNIPTRYRSYLNDYPCLTWQKDYVEFIRNDEDEFEVVHANTIDEFKENLRKWKQSFVLRKRHGSVIYRPFLDFLINDAPDHYLYGLVENIKRQNQLGF